MSRRGFESLSLRQGRFEYESPPTWVLGRVDPGKVLWRAAVAVDRDAALAQL
jgi:hypothetical protein